MLAYTLTLPRNTAWEAQRASQFMEQLLFSFEGVILRIVAQPKSMTWQLVDLGSRDPSTIENAIRTSYPQVHIALSQEAVLPLGEYPFYRYVIKYQHALSEFVAPILHVGDIKEPDPLALVTQSMSRLQAGESVIYTLVVIGLADYAYKEGEQQVTRKVYDGSLLGLIFPRQEERYIPKLQRVVEDKLQQRLYQCALFIEINTPQPERLNALLLVDSQIVHYDRPHFNALRYIPEDNPVVAVQDDQDDLDSGALGTLIEFMRGDAAAAHIRQLRQKARLILEPREIAALWHLPHSGHTANTITWARSSEVEIPQAMKGETHGLYLGSNLYTGQRESVYLPEGDRDGHCLIVGKTGTGKSTLMHHLVHQDIQAGRGVAVIDPHGHLIQAILQTSIPEGREADVVLLDLSQHEHPIPLNPLRALGGQIAVERMVGIFDRLYPDLSAMPQTGDALENALFTLQAEPQATLRDIARLFTDERYRQNLLDRVEDEVVAEFWQHDFASLSLLQQKQISLPVTRRMRSFYRNPYVRAVLCHPEGLDFGAFMRQRKIILVSLNTPEERIPERERELIGAFIIARLQMAAMSGAAQDARFYIYIDEVQRFVTTAIERIFSEARKFNLSLTVANQYLRQLTGGTLEAVMGNIGALITFQTGDDDARALAQYLKPHFNADDLIHLDKYQTALWLRYHGLQQPAFSLTPEKPLPKSDETARRVVRIRQTSIQQYTPKSHQAVLSWLEQRYQMTEPAEAEEQFIEPLEE